MNAASEWGTAKPGILASIYIGAIRNRIARGRLKRLLRNLLASSDGVYDVDVDGLRLRCHVADNTSERAVVERGLKEIDTLNLITKDLGPGDVFFDVGANCGIFALYAAKKVGPAGKVIAIEPITAMSDRLHFNIRANNFSNIDVVGDAVGDQPGVLTLHVDPKHLGRSCATQMTGYEPVKVMVTTLAKIVEAANVSKIDALKIDIEGYEDRALLPYVASMPEEKWPKKIMMEILLASRWERDCIGELIKAGYRQTWRSKQDILLEL